MRRDSHVVMGPGGETTFSDNSPNNKGRMERGGQRKIWVVDREGERILTL